MGKAHKWRSAAGTFAGEVVTVRQETLRELSVVKKLPFLGSGLLKALLHRPGAVAVDPALKGAKS